MIAGSETGNGRASSLTGEAPLAEPLDERATRGVGKRREGALEDGRGLILNHQVKYQAGPSTLVKCIDSSQLRGCPLSRRERMG